MGQGAEPRTNIAQTRKRVGTSRSISLPPGFAGSKERSSSRSEQRKQGERSNASNGEVDNGESRDTDAKGGYRQELSGDRGDADGAVGSHNLQLRRQVSTQCTTYRYTDPQVLATTEAELPHEDFVEGGVELSPSEGGAEGSHDDHVVVPPPTRPLPPWGDRQLEEFWRSASTEQDGQRALFLDYDGTLREFENRPELATPTKELEELLIALNAREDLAPCIISGRDAKFLGDCFGTLSRFTLIAEHGFQIWQPESEGWRLTDHPDGLDKDHDDWKAIVREEMVHFVETCEHSFIEEKSSSLVWHYREVQDQDKAADVASQAMERLERLKFQENLHKVRISHGHKVVEVSYRKVRKGPVMRRLCEEKALYGKPFSSVLVAGDDVSDESMFDIAPDDFLTIKVGLAETTAKFRVKDPVELRAFLWKLAGAKPSSSA